MMYILTKESLSTRGCEWEYKRSFIVSSYNKEKNNSDIVDGCLPVHGEAINPPSPSCDEENPAESISPRDSGRGLTAIKNQDSAYLKVESSKQVFRSANGRAIRMTRNVEVRLLPEHTNLNDRVEQGRFACGLINHLRIMASSPHSKCGGDGARPSSVPIFPDTNAGKRNPV